jgi:NAD/NADP transhydrogenase alpha subunit
MVSSVQLSANALPALARVQPMLSVAVAASTPGISRILDPAGSGGSHGLYELDDGRLAIAASALSTGTALPGDGLILKVGDKSWTPGKAVPVALIESNGEFRILMKSGEGAKAKFSAQSFDALGLTIGKVVNLGLADALDAEITANQDINGDSALGNVVTSAVDQTDAANNIGLYVLTSGKVIIDDDRKNLNSLAGGQAKTLTVNGKNWTPGKLTALAVRSTTEGYEVLLRSGTGAKAKYFYQSFDATGATIQKAQKTANDVLLDRELLYGQDISGEGRLGNVVSVVVDPTAPIEKNLSATSSYARSTKVNGEVFLGGKFIELGLSAWGNFGTAGAKPAGFYGAPGINGIGMSADHDGYGIGRNLPIDYFLPGTPEERFAVGFQVNATTSTTSNSERMNDKNMQTVVSNDSQGRTLAASATSSWSVNGSSAMTVKQDISFDAESLWFKNHVTITNNTATDWTSARYMRSFDPDNTAAQNGRYDTSNTVIGNVATDGYAAVKAQTYMANDPLFSAFNSRSPIMFFSMDQKAVGSIFGFSNRNPYVASAYATPAQRNVEIRADQAITLTWDTGPLATGASASFDYYTSLDNRAAEAIISEIYGVGLYKLQSGMYAVGKAPADEGDLPQDRVILKSGVKIWNPKAASPIAVKANSEGYQVTYKTGVGTKTKYFLQNFDPEGQSIGKPEKLTMAKTVDLETAFQQDINGDNMLGNKITDVIDASDPGGNIGLYKVAAGSFWIATDSLSVGSDLSLSAKQLTIAGKTWATKKETPLAVRVNGSGLYELVVRAGKESSPKFSEFTIDTNGAFEGKGRSLKLAEIADKETVYNQDLNGNGIIGG